MTNADFFDTIGETKVPEVQKETQGYDGPPRFNWLNGAQSPNSKMPDVPGSFFMAEKEIKGFTPGGPWEAEERGFRNGSERGYTAGGCGIILIARRSQAFANIKDGKGTITDREYHPRWFKRETLEQIPRSQWPLGVTRPSESVYTEWLCLADGWYGLDEAGNIVDPHVTVWTSRGMIGRALEYLTKDYKSGLLAAAEAVAKRELPWWAFRLPFGPLVNDKGKPIFRPIEGQQSTYQPPMLVGVPSKAADVPRELISSLYVGKHFLEETGFELYTQYEKWRTTLRPSGPSRSPITETAPAGNGQPDHYDQNGGPIYSPQPVGARAGAGPNSAAVQAGVADALAGMDEVDDIPF